jgi:hypothetical protein
VIRDLYTEVVRLQEKDDKVIAIADDLTMLESKEMHVKMREMWGRFTVMWNSVAPGEKDFWESPPPDRITTDSTVATIAVQVNALQHSVAEIVSVLYRVKAEVKRIEKVSRPSEDGGESDELPMYSDCSDSDEERAIRSRRPNAIVRTAEVIEEDMAHVAEGSDQAGAPDSAALTPASKPGGPRVRKVRRMGG